MTNRTIKWTLTASAVGALGLAFLAGRAIASGIPAEKVLTYSGYLEDATGAPVKTAQAIDVDLFAAQTGGTSLCQTNAPGTAVTNGRFSVPLNDTCVPFVKANPDLYVEVRVGGTPLGRTKLGAVPYAVEADHAVSATSATNATTAAGALKTQVDGHESRLGALEAAAPSKSGFRARKTQPQSVPVFTDVKVTFDSEDFDFANEYDPATSTFTTKTGGYYQVSCRAMWDVQGPGVASSGLWSTEIWVNGVVQGIDDQAYGDGYYVARTATDLVALAPNDRLTCIAYQQSGTQSLRATVADGVGNYANTFSAIRISP